MKHLRFKVIFMALALFFSMAGLSEAMSLSEAVQIAVDTNPRIEVVQARQRASRSGYLQAAGRLFPEIDIEADVGKQRVDRPQGLGPEVNNVWRKRRQVTATISQVLFDGFERGYDIYRSQARISAETYRVMARSQAVGLNAVEAYIDVVRHQKLLSLSRENIERHRKLAEIIRASFEGGNVPLGDLEQTEERVEAAIAFKARIKVNLAEAKAKFREIVGINPPGLRPVAYARNLPRSIEAAVEIASQNNPRIHATSADIDIARYEKKQFQSTLYPKINLEGSYTRGDNLDGTPGRNDEITGKIVLRWKLFAGGIRQNRVNELAEREFERMAEQDQLLRELRREIETAWARLTEGRAQVEAVRKQLAQNEKLVETYLDEYNAGRRELLDVLNAENASFGNQFELSNLSALHIYSSYQLLAHIGILLDRMGVTAPTNVIDENTPLAGFTPSPTGGQFYIPSLD